MEGQVGGRAEQRQAVDVGEAERSANVDVLKIRPG